MRCQVDVDALQNAKQQAVQRGLSTLVLPIAVPVMVMMLPMAPSMCPMIVTATAATTTTTLWVASWCPAVGIPTRDDNVGASVVVVGAIQLPCRLPHRSQPQRVEIGLGVHVLCTVPGSRQTFHLSPLPCRTCCSAQGFAGAVPHESALQATRNTEVRAHACCRRYRATHTQPHTRTHTHTTHTSRTHLACRLLRPRQAPW